MSDNNGWPGKPGVPLNPERDGWHWVCAAVGIAAPYPMLWCADGKAWDTGDGWEFYTSPRMTERTRYLGPALTPAEVDALTTRLRRSENAIYNALLFAGVSAQSESESPTGALNRLHDKYEARVTQARRDALEEAAHELKERSAFWAERTNYEALILADECQKIVDVLNAMAKGEGDV
jgi:hypothetical protein